ncbi:MAG: metallophosphoesterase [Thermoplasmata archaeon]|nr:metallophosphoesterase [Thermoplasmata archaeon]
MVIDEKISTPKIGVISDSHDNMEAIKKAVEFFNENDVELVIHAGDIVSPFTADEFKKLNCDMLLIYGNNDGDKLYLKERFSNIGEFHLDPYSFELYGKKIVVTHMPSIVDALATKYDIVIYGHTHKKDLRKEKALILNPGENCGYLTGVRSVALLYPHQMDARIVEL